MKKLAGCLALALLLAACATDAERMRTKALYDKYDKHCREHAREVVGEKTEEVHYRECMDYFITTDVHCPDCVVDPHLKRP